MDKYCHQNLDTLQLSRRIRELLSIHNIGQRLFAKYVLGLSQVSLPPAAISKNT